MLNEFGGLAVQMPVYAGFLTLACFASLGLPSLAGFIAEFLSFVGAFSVEATRIFACLGVIGVIITAAFFLWTIQRLLLGPLNERWKDLPDMKLFEWVALSPLALLMVAIGLFPNPLVLNIVNTSVHAILKGMGGG
jgi:NADH-quinone oxidoreductase subunit M